ncbi:MULTISPECIES: Tim44-like domain-containing protein [Ramlibacter]|uniref:Tim44 domain-containing protein n=1 Tax=Ramlibacter aquaticus TaxID=2780094 RepID=A0ABR9SF62_9BURK|nr:MULTISPECIES: Tim44-like domain-containing protein [Ramlibacter]MBE7941003.1 Tim44 domain-containing protein [Ramlibacter aquaticus]
MRKTLAWMAVVLAVGLTAGMNAEAKRLGGGKSAGMQRQSVTAPAQQAGTGATPGTPGQGTPAAGSTAAPAAPAAAAGAQRSWMGPLAGIAAGLGIAALASHFGLGGALASMLSVALVAMAAMALVAFLLRKRAAASGGALAGAYGGTPPATPGVFRAPGAVQDVHFRPSSAAGSGGGLIGSHLEPAGQAATAAAAVGHIPAGFDTAGFERTARDQFMALQAANDARDMDRLRDYLSPEMFGVVRAEIAERGEAVQHTEVFGLTAQVVDVAEEAERYVVSVRFRGSIREQAGAVPDDLDEVWHLSKARQGFGGWMIAGIQQTA